jgi:dihydroorotate dehydrogenase (fumarate)
VSLVHLDHSLLATANMTRLADARTPAFDSNVHRLRSLLDDYPDPRVRNITLIGVGGVCDSESAERFRKAGADAVAVATALGREGIVIFEKIRKGSS